jgi:hypothetical protein
MLRVSAQTLLRLSNSVNTRLLSTAILLQGFLAFGQVRPADQQFTVANQFQIISFDQEARPITASIETQGHPTRSIKFPDWVDQGDYFEQRYWAFRSEKIETGRNKLTLQSSPDGKNWHFEAEYIEEGGPRVFGIHPIDSNFYLMSAYAGFRLGDKSSPVAIGKRNDGGRIEIVELIELPIAGPYLQKESKTEKPEKSDALGFRSLTPKYTRYFFNLGKSGIVRSSSGLVMASFETGFIWNIRSSASGSPSIKRSSLFRIQKEDLEAGKKFEYGILGMQPSPSGSVLIATRSQDAVWKSRSKYATEPVMSKGTEAEKGKLEADQLAAFNGSIKEYPEIEWWSLEPETGTVRPEQAPINVPDRFTDYESFKKFRFRFKPDGNLLVNYQ